MLYPVYVHVGDKKHAHGIEFPDFPGCFSAADDWQEINPVSYTHLQQPAKRPRRPHALPAAH